MNTYRTKLFDQTMRRLTDTCKQCLKNNNALRLDPVEAMIGIRTVLAKDLIKKVIIALPDGYFYKLSTQQRELLSNTIADEFILFQAQERVDDPGYYDIFREFIFDINVTIKNSLLDDAIE